MRVLIVDDSRVSRMMLKKVLPPALLTDLVEAGGGEEAISVCRTQSVDLMFLDLTMPNVDGYQVLETLRESGRTPPTIVVSADIQPLAVERVIALGALAFLKKTPERHQIDEILGRAKIDQQACGQKACGQP